MRIVDPAVRIEVCTPRRLPLIAIASAPDCHSKETSSCKSESVTTRTWLPFSLGSEESALSPLTESGLATVRTMPSPCTGSVPLTISSSCIVWFRDQLAKDSDSDSICDRKSLTSLVRSPTRFVCSVSWLANCLRTSLRGSVLSWRTKTLPAAPTAMQMRNTRILVAQIETAERFLVARRESEYRTSIGRLVKSSISRSESSSTCLWRCGMAGMEAGCT